jgi:hypothetical protein
MSTDYAEKEREFLDGLKADTGRDLGEWMQLISVQSLAHRNDIIDWLRQQGFRFSRASWLERIHHNGGKPIYADSVAASRPAPIRRPSRQPPAAPPPSKEPLTAVAAPSPEVIETPSKVAEAQRASSPSPLTDATAKLDHLLAKAKAYRPLAQFLMAEIGRTVPGVTFAPETAHISVRKVREFAVLAISPRELRFGLDLGTRPFDDTLKPAKFTSPASRISPKLTHMVILTDARQITREFLALVAEAAERED